MAIKSADQITIVDVTDAYSVILTSEAYTFVGGTNGVASGATCSTQAVAYCGASQCSTVSVKQADIQCPTGISAAVTTNNTSAVTITFTTTATVSSACEATIPVVVDGITVNKKFSFAVAKTGATGATGQTGADGNSITKTTVTYQVGTSGTSAPTGTWSSTPVATTTAGQYLWTRTVTEYSKSDPTTTYSVAAHGATGAKGDTGDAGADGNSITSVTTTYQVGTNATTAPTGTWSNSPVATTAAGQYLWTKTVTKYSKSADTTTYSVAAHGAKGDKGATGDAGADAITMTITSSAGTIFKNSSGSTVLTAHVFVGGVEQSITDAGVCGSYGSVKWYKGSSTTAAATSKTLTISASEVASSLAVTAQLE